MKAVIVEIEGKHAAILSDDGLISKIRNKNYSLGQEITIINNSMKSNKIIKMTAAAAAAIMIFVTPAWAYLTPYSYVSVDVNPSFEFYINRFDRVLTVKALNDDGKELSKDINIEGLKNKEIQSAVRNVLNELKDKGYIIEGKEGGVIVATSSKSKEKTDILFEKMQNAVNEDVGLKEEENIVIRGNVEEPNKAESKDGKESEIRQENGETSYKTDDPDKQKELKDQEKEGKEKQEEKEEQKEQEKREKKIEKVEKEREKEIEKREKEREKEIEKREKERDKEIEKHEKEVEKQEERLQEDNSQKSNKQDRKSDGKVIEVTEKEVNEAKKLGITPGKLNLIEKLQEAAIAAGYKDKIKIDDWIDKSVQEINSQIKEYREELKQENNKNSNEDNKSNKDDKNNKNDKPNDSNDRKEKNRN